jgi:hypothetical protein
LQSGPRRAAGYKGYENISEPLGNQHGASAAGADPAVEGREATAATRTQRVPIVTVEAPIRHTARAGAPHDSTSMSYVRWRRRDIRPWRNAPNTGPPQVRGWRGVAPSGEIVCHASEDQWPVIRSFFYPMNAVCHVLAPVAGIGRRCCGKQLPRFLAVRGTCFVTLEYRTIRQ